jgi:hypothetical protein
MKSALFVERKWNFQRFVEGELLMYIPLATIRRVWEAA